MQPPSNLKQIRGFVGMVNYYRDMWLHRSHILAPITAKTCAPKKGVNSLTAKSVPAGARLVLFGRYTVNLYVGIVQ